MEIGEEFDSNVAPTLLLPTSACILSVFGAFILNLMKLHRVILYCKIPYVSVCLSVCNRLPNHDESFTGDSMGLE